MRNARITTRLVLGFGVILLLMIITTLVGISEVRKIDTSLTTINDLNSVKQRFAINFRGSVHDRAIAVRDYILTGSATDHQKLKAEIDRLAAAYSASAKGMTDILAKTPADAEEKKILDDINAIEARTLKVVEQIIADTDSGRLDAGKSNLMTSAAPAFVDWLAAINRFIDLQEARNKAITDQTRMVAARFEILMEVVTGLSVLLGGCFAFWIIRSVRPLKPLTATMLDLAKGDLSVQIPDIKTRDEVGEIAGAMQVFLHNAKEARRLEDAQKAEQEERLRRSEAVAAAVRDFEQRIEGIVSSLSASAGTMNGMASDLAGSLGAAADQSASVASAAEVASGNVQTVAAAAEEMSASLQTITTNVSDTASTAKACAAAAQQSAEKLEDLQQAVDDIDAVIQAIDTVARQTNLLALNATIEASRAGDAGKGFAVVASEVKTLASRTHDMTEEIAKRVEHIKDSARDTILSVNDILDQIGLVDAKTASVAEAVEQQNAATAEISRNVQHAATGTGDVTRTIVGVRETAISSAESTKGLTTSAEDLSRQADILRSAVQAFLREVRNG